MKWRVNVPYLERIAEHLDQRCENLWAGFEKRAVIVRLITPHLSHTKRTDSDE